MALPPTSTLLILQDDQDCCYIYCRGDGDQGQDQDDNQEDQDCCYISIVVGMKVAPLPSCRTERHILSLSPSSRRMVPVGIPLLTISLTMLIFECTLDVERFDIVFAFSGLLYAGSSWKKYQQ